MLKPLLNDWHTNHGNCENPVKVHKLLESPLLYQPHQGRISDHNLYFISSFDSMINDIINCK